MWLDFQKPPSLFRRLRACACVRACAQSSSSSLRDSTRSRTGEEHWLCALFRTALVHIPALPAETRSSAGNIPLLDV